MGRPLAGHRFVVAGDGIEAAEATFLLTGLGATVGPATGATPVNAPANDPAAAWAASGAMRLTGRPDDRPLVPAAPVAPVVLGAVAVLRALSRLVGTTVEVDGPALLAERAAIAGLTRQGHTSAGGACRLLPAHDGWVAVSLARPGDLELLPAWIGVTADGTDPPWDAVAGAVKLAHADQLAGLGQLLGIPVAAVPADTGAVDEQAAARHQPLPPSPMLLDGRPLLHEYAHESSAPPTPPRRNRPLVVDLSSLWAGPLCAHLLGLAGARVVKVESTARPDGARLGPPPFYELLHAGHESVALDFTDVGERNDLRDLIAAADVVIEGSRPRALTQLGIEPAAVRTRRPSQTWVSITGYGRTGPWNNRIAFGDDAAAAAGLVVPTADGPVFCGDAIADPLAGMYAAVGALASLAGGGGHMVDVALREAAGHVAATPGPTGSAEAAAADISLPRARTPVGRAPASGADTARVLHELGIRR